MNASSSLDAAFSRCEILATFLDTGAYSFVAADGTYFASSQRGFRTFKAFEGSRGPGERPTIMRRGEFVLSDSVAAPGEVPAAFLLFLV